MSNRPHRWRRSREYQVWSNYIELRFDDPRCTAKGNTGMCTLCAAFCVELEDIAHVYMCYELGLSYDCAGPKIIEFRTTKLAAHSAVEPSTGSGAALRARVTELRWLSNERFRLRLAVRINERTRIDFEGCGVLSESARFVSIQQTA